MILAIVTFVALPGIRDPENSDPAAAAFVAPVAKTGEKIKWRMKIPRPASKIRIFI